MIRKLKFFPQSFSGRVLYPLPAVPPQGGGKEEEPLTQEVVLVVQVDQMEMDLDPLALALVLIVVLLVLLDPVRESPLIHK